MQWTKERLPVYTLIGITLSDERKIRYCHKYDGKGQELYQVKPAFPFMRETEPIVSGLSQDELVDWLNEHGAELGVVPMRGGAKGGNS